MIRDNLSPSAGEAHLEVMERLGKSPKDMLPLQINISNLADGDVLTIHKHQFGSIGQRSRLGLIAIQDSHSDKIRRAILSKLREYIGFRKIRGDGNCYYRSVIFGMLEQTLFASTEERARILRIIIKIFRDVDYSDTVKQRAHSDMILRLTKAAEGTCWLHVSDLEYSFLDKGFDRAVITVCRELVSRYLKKYQHEKMAGDGLTLNEAILPSYPFE